jgi:hypothetical protein
MIRKSILLYLIILFSCEPHSEKMTKEYYSNGTLKCEYKLVNNNIDGDYIEYWENGNIKEYGKYVKGKREGVFITLFSNGKTYRNYLNGKLDGWSERNVNSHKLRTNYKADIRIYETEVDTILNDTLLLYKDFHLKKFYNINKLHGLGYTNDSDTINSKSIYFDTNGRIEYYQGPLNFLTKTDSADLDKFIPDWKKQVKECENKKNGGNGSN